MISYMNSGLLLLLSVTVLLLLLGFCIVGNLCKIFRKKRLQKKKNKKPNRKLIFSFTKIVWESVFILTIKLLAYLGDLQRYSDLLIK